MLVSSSGISISSYVRIVTGCQRQVMLVSTCDISISSYVTFCQGVSASSDVGVCVILYQRQCMLSTDVSINLC